MTIMKYESIIITRPGVVTNVLSRAVPGTPTTITGEKASIQPLDRLTMGGDTTLFEGDGNRNRQYRKIYCTVELLRDDVITEVQTSKIYKVVKVSDYDGYGMTVDHYKSIIYLIED